MYVRFFVRNYPLSTKLTINNAFLLILDMFACGAMWMVVLSLLDYPKKVTQMQLIAISAIFIILFIVIHRFINKYTDRKYEEIVNQYEKELDKLIEEDIEQVKGKKLETPAHIKFRRVSSFYGCAVKVKYLINGKEYKLGNGQGVDITTDTALNTIKIKAKNEEEKYFTVKDNETISIEYDAYGILKRVNRHNK